MQQTNKDKVNLLYLKALNKYQEHKKHILWGMVFWLGIFLVIFGGRELYKQHQLASYTTYKSVETSPTAALKQINYDFNHKKPFTIVLYSPTCSDCKMAEKPLVKEFAKTRANSKADYILTDLTRFKPKQRQELIKKLPQLTVQGNKFYVPTVANVKPVDATHAKVTDINQNTSEALYSDVFANSIK